MALSMRRVLWLACLALLLGTPRLDARDTAFVADFDGDGQHDRATLTREEPSILRVWLSSTETTEIIRSGEPIVHLAAADLDGDRRPELIASGRTAALRIWTRGTRGFHAYRPRHTPPPSGFSHSARRAFDDGPAEPMEATPAPAPVAPWLGVRLPHGAPAFNAWNHTRRPVSADIAARYVTARGPRPPPVFLD